MKETPKRKKKRPVVGWREWVALPDLGVPAIKAKVDTGARSSSLHAWDVVEEEGPDGAAAVRFCIHPLPSDDAHVVAVTAPLLGHRDVRSSNGEVELRPVIRTTVVVRGIAAEVELSLARRDEMGFRMLLGRSAIRRRFLVNAGRSFLGGGTKFAPPGESLPGRHRP